MLDEPNVLHKVPCPVCTLEFLVPKGAYLMASERTGELQRDVEVWWEIETVAGVTRWSSHNHTMTPEVEDGEKDSDDRAVEERTDDHEMVDPG